MWCHVKGNLLMQYTYYLSSPIGRLLFCFVLLVSGSHPMVFRVYPCICAQESLLAAQGNHLGYKCVPKKYDIIIQPSPISLHCFFLPLILISSTHRMMEMCARLQATLISWLFRLSFVATQRRGHCWFCTQGSLQGGLRGHQGVLGIKQDQLRASKCLNTLYYISSRPPPFWFFEVSVSSRCLLI